MTLFFAALVIGAIAALIAVRLRSRSAAVHEADGLAKLRAAFGDRYPDALVRHAYGYLSERHGAAMPHYQVRPDDDLQKVYALADLDLEDAVLVIADRAGARIPRAQNLDELKGRVRTVDDLLQFLEPYCRPEAVQS